MEDIQKRRLVIRAFHADEVEFANKPAMVDGKLTVVDHAENNSELVVKSTVEILQPHDHDREE